MSDELTIELPDAALKAFVAGMETKRTIVFAQGSGSSRQSRRNQQVAAVMQEAGFTTVQPELMTTDVALEIVKGASHLFEEPGAIDRVAALGTAWFSDHLG